MSNSNPDYQHPFVGCSNKDECLICSKQSFHHIEIDKGATKSDLNQLKAVLSEIEAEQPFELTGLQINGLNSRQELVFLIRQLSNNMAVKLEQRI